MSTFKKPVVSQGWMRALLFLVIFTGVYLLGNRIYNESSLAKTINPVYAGAAIFSLSALVLVPIFTILVDRNSLTWIGFSWKMSTMNNLRGRNGDDDIDNAEQRTEPNDGFLGMLLAIALLGLGWLVLYFPGNLDYSGATFAVADLVSGIVLMGVVSLAEEAVFRGYILNNLLDSLDRWPALLISAFIFALLHISNPEAGLLAVFNVFLAGLLVGLAFVYTRNLWFAVFFHFSWNFIQGPVLGFAVSGLKLRSAYETVVQGNAIITGGKFGFEASIIQTILFVFAIGILYRFFEQRSSACVPTSRSKI